MKFKLENKEKELNSWKKMFENELLKIKELEPEI